VRRSRRTDNMPARRVLVRAGLVFVLLGVLFWVAITAYNGVPLKSYETMYVSVPETGNLLQHDQVRIAGVRVGQVRGTSITADGRARVKLQLDAGTKLPADTTVRVRANGLLGARYIQLVPGRSATRLASGSTIRGNASSLTYGLPEALDTFDRQTRGGLGTAVRELGKGVLGQGQPLNTTLHLSGRQIVPFEQFAETVLARPGATGRLLPSLDRLMTPLDAARVDIGNLFAPASAALQPFVDQRSATQATLDAAPGALAAANAGLGTGQRLLAAVDTLAVQANRTLPPAPAGLRATTALLRDSHTSLQRATTLLHAAQPAIPAALKITAAVSPTLTPLQKGLTNGTPIVQQLGPYGCNLENFGAVLRSLTGFGGLGSGPGGPAIAFRLIALPSLPTETLGIKDFTGLVKHNGYYAPCAYDATPYPTTLGTLARKAGR